jgi:hypothetical protein
MASTCSASATVAEQLVWLLPLGSLCFCWQLQLLLWRMLLQMRLWLPSWLLPPPLLPSSPLRLRHGRLLLFLVPRLYSR